MQSEWESVFSKVKKCGSHDSARYEMRAPEPQIIAVAGGKGGVGKTVFTAMLGIGLAGFARRTIVMDLDFSGADLHGCLNMGEWAHSLNSFLNGKCMLSEAVQPAAQEHLSFIPLHTDFLNPRQITAGSKRRLFAEMKKLKADYVIIDVGSASADVSLDAFLSADHPIVLTTGDLFSVLNTYTFIRRAFVHGIRRLTGSADLHAVLETCARLHDGKSIKPLLQQLERSGEHSPRSELMRAFRSHFRPKVVLNCFQPNESLHNFMLLAGVIKDYLGVAVENWGRVRYDPAIRKALCRRRPDLLFTAFSRAGEDVVRLVVRRLLAAEQFASDIRTGTAMVPATAAETVAETMVCQKKCMLWHICPAACEGVQCARMDVEPMRKTG